MTQAKKKTASKKRPTTKHKNLAKATPTKRVSHHAKRLYHATPKFVHGMVFGAVVGALVVGFLGASFAHPTSTSAESKCDAHGIGDRTLTHDTNNTAYSIQGNKTTVTFNVVGNNCNLPVTMVVWKAPNGTTGKPYSQQTLFFHTTGTFKEGRHQMTGTLPACYFQVDTVVGTKLTGSTGQAFNYDTRQVAFMHGGTKSCTQTPKPPVVIQVCDLLSHEVVNIDKDDFDSSKYSKDITNCENQIVTPPPSTTPTPPTPVEVTSSSATLPNTGPGAVLIIFGLAMLGGYVFHMTHRHRQHKKHAHAATHRRKPAHHSAR